MRLDLDQMRAAWIARFGTDWVDAVDVWDDNYFFPIAQDLARLAALDINGQTDEFRIKLTQ